MKKIDLSVEFCGVRFPNPFVLAAAPPTDSGDMIARGFDAGWGGAVVKTLGLEHVEVNLVSPMMAGLKYEDKNLIGLENIDLISDRDIASKMISMVTYARGFPSALPHPVLAGVLTATDETGEEEFAKMCNHIPHLAGKVERIQAIGP